MNKIISYLSIRNLVVIGILLRVVFMIWGAPIYYGSQSYATQGGDLDAWIKCMQNLVHTGTFTADPNFEDGKYFRPPGYSFFLMIFYFLSGFNMTLMFKLAQASQIILDTASIWLVYHIVKNNNGNENIARISAFLYCTYPFAIVWAPYLYAETSGIFFMMLSIYFFTKTPSKKNYIIAGISLGFAVLLRVPIIFAAPAFAYYLWRKHKSFSILFRKPLIYFFIAFSITYGSWPARNLMHGKFIPAEELRNDKHFSADYYAFMFYIWSVKTDHNPQFEQIIHGEKVDWPKASYLHPSDSATLAELAIKCNTCGRGFSHFKYSAGIIDKPIFEETACTKEIAEKFDQLRKEQINENPLHYYLIVPLNNLQKALFKLSLYGNKNRIVVIASTILFSYRSLFIFLGLLGIWLNKSMKVIDPIFLQLILIYFIIEIRYFLMNDILLLIPASIVILKLISMSPSKQP
jgi:hypothetical protein